MLKHITAFITFGAIALGAIYAPATAADAHFGPSNPFYAPSTLPFHAPPFDKIKDEDYQPAIEAGNPEALRLLDVTYDGFVRSGAKLSDADKTELKKLNEEISTLSNAFSAKLLAATKDGAYVTADKSALV